MFVNNRKTLIGKVEATPYTSETLADGDFNVRVRDITYSKEIVEYQRKLALGHLDMSESVMGKQTGSISFSVELAVGDSAGSAPNWGKFLLGCGFAETVYAGTGVGYTPNRENTHIPLTIAVQEISEGASASALVTTLAGCVGTVKFSLASVGEPIQMQFEFQGRLESVADVASGSVLVPTDLPTAVPPAILTSCVDVNSISQDLDALEIDIGNDVQMWGDPCEATGVKGFFIAGKESVATLDPFAKLITDEPVFTDWKNAVIVDLDLTTTGTIPFNINCPQIQYTAVGDGDRNGALTAEKTFRLLGSASGDDSITILQGATV